MRILQVLAVAVALSVALLALPAATEAQNNNASFHTFISALNNNDATTLAQHMAADFTLTFTGGTTVSGDEAQDMLLLLDRPIQIVSVKPLGQQRGEAVLIFGSGQGYTVQFTGARGGQLASLTIVGPASGASTSGG